jgi:isopenicillin-N epimerase
VPDFGPGLRDSFLLEPGGRFLNHGSFGATPRVVLQAADQWRRAMETNPDRFMKEVLPQALRAAAQRLAAFLNARAENLVFIENATAGISTVLRSLDLMPDDEILSTNHRYGAVRQAIAFVCGRSGARYVEADLALPMATTDAMVKPILERLTNRTKLLLIDHVASPTGLVFPLAPLVAAARQSKAKVLIDGAHAPGQIALDVPAIGADWYVGNCHKWLFAPKNTGFLWAAEASKHAVHPLAISHAFGQSFTAEFDWTGTRDFSAWLAVTDALHFIESIGADRTRAYNHRLAVDAARTIAARWHSEVDGADVLHAAMMAVRLPVSVAASEDNARQIQSAILREHGIAVAVNAVSGSLWARISGQIYNGAADYQALADLNPASLHSRG